MAAGKDFTV